MKNKFAKSNFFFSSFSDTSRRRDKTCLARTFYRNSIRSEIRNSRNRSERDDNEGQLRSNCRHCRIGFVLEFQNALQMQCLPRKVHGLRCFLPTVRRNKSRLRKRVSLHSSTPSVTLFSEICHLFFSFFFPPLHLFYFFFFFFSYACHRDKSIESAATITRSVSRFVLFRRDTQVHASMNRIESDITL